MRPAVTAFIGAAVAAAGVAFGFGATGLASAFHHHPTASLCLLAATLAMQLFSLRLPGQGSISVSAVGVVAGGILLGAGFAMALGIAAALVQWGKSRGLAHRAAFDSANLVLSAGAAALVFHSLGDLHSSGTVRLVAGITAALVYLAVNAGLLSLAMSLSERSSVGSVWQERLHWARYHLLAVGPLAVLTASAYATLGAVSVVAFVVPAVLLGRLMRDAVPPEAEPEARPVLAAAA